MQSKLAYLKKIVNTFVTYVNLMYWAACQWRGRD